MAADPALVDSFFPILADFDDRIDELAALKGKGNDVVVQIQTARGACTK